MVNYKFGNDCFNLRTSCVLLDRDKVLLQYDDTGLTYVLPGGRPELHEDSSIALKREMMEELGIDVIIERLLFVAENFFVDSGINCHEISFIYLANPAKPWDEIVCEWPHHAKEGNLNIHFDWFDADKLENTVLYPVFLRKALNQELTDKIRHLIIKP